MILRLYQKIIINKLINEELKKEENKNNKELKEIQKILDEEIKKNIIEGVLL